MTISNALTTFEIIDKMFLIWFVIVNLNKTLFWNFAFEQNVAVNNDQRSAKLNELFKTKWNEIDSIYQFVFENRSTILWNCQQIIDVIVFVKIHFSKFFKNFVFGLIVQWTEKDDMNTKITVWGWGGLEDNSDSGSSHWLKTN